MKLGLHRFYCTPSVGLLWKCRRPTPKWKKMNKVLFAAKNCKKNMGRGQITLVLWVKERSSSKTHRMHQNSPFWEPKSNNFLRRGHSPLPRSLPRWGGAHPLPTPHPLGAFGASILAPAALASAPTAPRSSSPHWFCLQIPPWTNRLKLWTEQLWNVWILSSFHVCCVYLQHLGLSGAWLQLKGSVTQHPAAQ